MQNALSPWSPAAQAFRPGTYEHFKGNRYVAIGLAHHSETLEEMVVYHHGDATQELWVRPLSMWNETVERDGYHGPRFRYVGPAN